MKKLLTITLLLTAITAKSQFISTSNCWSQGYTGSTIRLGKCDPLTIDTTYADGMSDFVAKRGLSGKWTIKDTVAAMNAMYRDILMSRNRERDQDNRNAVDQRKLMNIVKAQQGLIRLYEEKNVYINKIARSAVVELDKMRSINKTNKRK